MISRRTVFLTTNGDFSWFLMNMMREAGTCDDVAELRWADCSVVDYDGSISTIGGREQTEGALP